MLVVIRVMFEATGVMFEEIEAVTHDIKTVSQRSFPILAMIE